MCACTVFLSSVYILLSSHIFPLYITGLVGIQTAADDHTTTAIHIYIYIYIYTKHVIVTPR